MWNVSLQPARVPAEICVRPGRTGSATVPDMGSAYVVAVNRGRTREMLVGGKPARSGINKQPATGEVAIGFGGLALDEYADKANHGGRDQAVYAYAREDLDWWSVELGRELRDGL